MTQIGHTYNFRTLVVTYFGLLFLAALMVGISLVDVTGWESCTDTGNFLCALAHILDLHTVRTAAILGVALIMGVLTALVMMGLAFEHKLINAVIFLSNFPFLAIFVVFTYADHAFRGETDRSFTEQIGWESPVIKANQAAKKDSASTEGAGH
jgi:hypothetical protein